MGLEADRERRTTGSELHPEKGNGFYGGPVTARKPREVYAWIAGNRGKTSVSLCCAALKVRGKGTTPPTKAIFRCYANMLFITSGRID